MYISFEQIETSLKELDPINPFFGISFLAFKQLNLPMGEPQKVDIADQEALILEAYYNPIPNSNYYYVPLRSTGPKKRWVSKRKYSDSGLQKTRTTTFIKAFIHPNKNEWAWRSDYISKLMAVPHFVRVPVFHLAVWILRDRDWLDDTTPQDIINYFCSLFSISDEEQHSLFDMTIPQTLPIVPVLQNEPVTWKNLRQITGSPPDESPDEGGGLESLELIGVGPARSMKLDLASRLNLITGDNGLGKTFLLECAWWALSGSWADSEQPAYPRSNSARPAIVYKISGTSDRPKAVYFDKNLQQWASHDEKRPVLPGIVIYARVDGSSVIWDPAKHYWVTDGERARSLETSDAIRLTQNQLWDGLEITLSNGKKQSICNGLVRDWITWQFIHPTPIFETFSRVLQKLSPSHNEITLIPGTPIKLPRDDREVPRLKLPYDEVPVTLLSAGIKRILSMAYLLVWTWESHKEATKHIGKPPQSKIVLIIDEMEAHLHPRWQRVIVPALLEVVRELEQHLEIQLIIATHSPLVLASVEPIFDGKTDSLFTLDLIGKDLEVKEVPYVKQGSVNSWLTSEVFDLQRAYSVEAELALVDAKNLQLTDHPDPEQVKLISQRLIEYLPSIDPFWPRWKFFAEKHGVKL